MIEENYIAQAFGTNPPDRAIIALLLAQREV